MILALLLMLVQNGLLASPDPAEARAAAAVSNAWQGRAEALHMSCGDAALIARIEELDRRLSGVLASFSRRFRHDWRDQNAEPARLGSYETDAAGRVTAGPGNPYCRQPSGFQSRLSEYENGLYQAEAALAR